MGVAAAIALLAVILCGYVVFRWQACTSEARIRIGNDNSPLLPLGDVSAYPKHVLLMEETLVHKWDLEFVLRTVEYYRRNVHRFGNKDDFLPAMEIIRATCSSTSKIYVVGVNHGQSLGNVLDVCGTASIWGFEIMKEYVDEVSAKYKHNPSITIHHVGVSDKPGMQKVIGSGEMGGLYRPEGRWKHLQSAIKVRTDTLAAVTNAPVDYTIIDVEGHEQEAIIGMNLTHNARLFPVFQYELGGTWADSRRTGPLSQFSVALLLQSLGYSIYLMGACDGMPCLLITPPEMYRLSTANTEGYSNRGQKYFVQGNALAVHGKHAPQSVLRTIDKLLIPSEALTTSTSSVLEWLGWKPTRPLG